jgi:DNA-binding MarR family transcriptional regulator
MHLGGDVEDVVRALGHLTLGTRLRRLGERLQTETQALIDRAQVEVPLAHFPALAAIDRLGPLSVGDLALALGVTQPGVTRMAGRLEADGLLASERSDGDRRVRRLALTERGQALVEDSKRDLWPVIEAAVAEACAELSGPLLAQLAGLEDALDETPLTVRAARAEGGARASAR